MLTSTTNPKIKQIRALQARARSRREEGAFVIEGVRLVEEAIAAEWHTQYVLYTPGLDERGNDIITTCQQRGIELISVSPGIMQHVSDTQTPQGILAVLSMKSLPAPADADFIMILDGVRDPGNMGTLLRTALAAGTDAVWLHPGVVDAYSPKVVRAAMGAHFRLPIETVSWEDVQKRAALQNLTLFLADSTEGLAYTEAGFARPLGLILGGEAHGASDQAWAVDPQPVHIPMPGSVESLNAAIAGAILLFEVVRQRT